MTQTLVTHTNETITPQQAKKYLDQNKLNRPVREAHVKVLLADILAGNFMENGEAGVTFDWNGNIAGGQHTLTAISRGDRPVTCRVTRGVDPAARATMNDGLHQKFADDLHVAGVVSATSAEPLLRKILVWENVEKDNRGQGGLLAWRITKMSRSHLAQQWPGYADEIIRTLTDTKRWAELWKPIGNRGALHMLWWLLVEHTRIPAGTVEEFLSRVVYGTQTEGERVLFQKLHMKLSENRDAALQVFWLLRAWDNWAAGVNVSKLQEPKGGVTDPYPKIRRPR
jgi:hypothetical protein